MNILKLKYQFILVFFSLVITSCSSKIGNGRIKSIQYYTVDGIVRSNKAKEIFKTKIGLHKMENLDLNGNLTRESEFDTVGNEKNVIENKYDLKNNLLEVLYYERFLNKGLSKTQLAKNIYNGDLLVETLLYYGTFESSGFWSKTTFSYNNKNQKIKVDFIGYNDDADRETLLFTWKNDFSYVEDRFDKEGILSERHFVLFDKKGQEIEHKINFEVSSNEDYTYQVYSKKTYDRYGNILTKKSKYVGKPVEKSVYTYLYVGKNWNYRLCKTDNDYISEFRKIEYY